MISNTLKVNAIILFAVALTASGGVYAQKLLTPHPRFHPLLSQPLKKYPGLKFHPHSEHYIYNFDTVENTDKPEFKDLASKLSQLPSNFPSKIILTTVSTSSDVSSEVLNQEELLTDSELYLISKYWLQLLPHFNSELLKCLAGPTEKPKKEWDQFPSNCPSEIRYLKQNTKTSSSTITITNTSFNIPQTLYSKVHKCSNSQCQPSSKEKNCYCAKKSCADCTGPNSCKCYPESKLTIGPRFFTASLPSNFSYPEHQSQSKPLQTFNATGNSKPNNPKPLPHFSFPLPHSSHTNPSIKNSGPGSLDKPIHWPQSITIYTNFALELNGQSHNTGYNSLDALVSKLLNSPTTFDTKIKLTASSPTQLFFPRYIATLYALLWSYSPDSLPLFPSNWDRSLLSEHDLDYLLLTLSKSQTPPSPLFNTHSLPSNQTTSQK